MKGCPPSIMKIEKLGHVVLKVKNLERAAVFYRDVLGMREVARTNMPRMVFFSFSQNHHDLACMEVGESATKPGIRETGLYHVALKVGNNLDDLRKVKRELLEKKVPILGQSDHVVSQSLYIEDPDGNEIELYVDADPRLWQKDPTLVANIRPLDL